MHEMSIAQSIIEIVRQHVPDAETPRVKSVKVRVGEAAGVVPESLAFCFQAATAETAFENALLQIEHVPFVIECKSCATTSEESMGLPICPACGSSDTKVLSGTELNIVEIELEETVPESP